MSKYIVGKPRTDIMQAPKPKVEDPPIADISVQRLMDDGLLALYREMKYLLELGQHGKLDAANSKDLRDHLKLLFELKDREEGSLKNMTDEQLKDRVKEALNDDK